MWRRVMSPAWYAVSVLVLGLVMGAVRGSATDEGPQYAAGMLSGIGPAGQLLFLPLRRTEVALNVTGGMVYAELTQVFANDTPYLLEAVYTYPLPARSTVCDMELRVANRVIRSIVKEREEARETYEQARSEGRRAALMEEERPNIFTTSVANLRAGEEVRVCFSYVESADYHDGQYEVTFPMVVGPRYVPRQTPAAAPAGATAGTTHPVTDAERICPPVLKPGVDPGHRVHLVATVRGLPAAEITSITHALNVRPLGADAFQVEPQAGPLVPNCDFNLRIRLAASPLPQVRVVREQYHDLSYGLITILPPLQEDATYAVAAREVVFLVDTSGSMNGDSIRQAQAGLKECLGMLQPADRFNIIRFAEDFTSFRATADVATAANVTAACAFVEGLKANGGTEMQPALAHVLAQPQLDSRRRVVIFLTDGCVGNEEALMALVHQSLDEARLFAIGIGSAPNEYLLRKLAELGHGDVLFLRSEEDVGVAMTQLFATIARPAMTDVGIHWRGAGGEDVDYRPAVIPDVFYGRPVQVYALLPQSFTGELVVTGYLDDRELAFRLPLPAGEPAAQPLLSKLYGRARVDELLFRHLLAPAGAKREALQKEIVALALIHQLVTPFTSRVAVEELVETKPDGTPVTLRVPTAMPKGWRLGATATQDGAWWLVGMALLLAAGVLGWRGWRRQSGVESRKTAC